MASEAAFAFGAILTRQSGGAAGRITFKQGEANDEPCPTLEEFSRALETRSALRWRGAGGVWTLEWL
jgi:hypothetical protein